MAPVSHRFSSVDPSEFREVVEEITSAEEQWEKLAVAQVESQTITPSQAVAILSAVKAHLYGYSEFNRELSPSDLVLLQSGG